jgi:hypothetical protein
VKSHFLPQRSSVLARCIFAVFCLSNEASFQTEAQTPGSSPALPQDILKGNVAFGQYTTFRNIPSATSASVFVDITLTDPSASPANLIITVYSGCPDSNTSRPLAEAQRMVLWYHELLLDAAGHPVTHIQSVVALDPFILNNSAPDPGTGSVGPDCDFSQNFIYTVQVIDDTFGTNSHKIGTFNACSLTINPVNPGHIGPPAVNLFEGAQNQPVPTQIDYGQPLTLIATALGNPSSFTITRLGITISNAEQVYRSPEIFQASSSALAPTLTYTPPVLAPGTYGVGAGALDSAGFSNGAGTRLTVNRLFGLFSVSNLTAQVNDNFGDPNFHTTTFTAQLNLKNNTATGSGNLRVRLAQIPSASFLDQDGPPPLPAPTELSQIPVQALAAGGTAQVSVSGVVSAPLHGDPDQHPELGASVVNFHVFAILDEFVDGQWITVDSLKVVDGVEDLAHGFDGPGGGVNDPNPGLGGTSFDPLILNSLSIDGPPSAAPGQHYMATATAKNSAGTTSKSADVTAQSQWSVNCPAGVFAPPSGATSAQVSASFTLGGVTRTMAKTVTVMPTPTATPIVHISVSPTQVTEGGSATFQISASPNTVRPVAVNYSLVGKSTFGVDYTLSGGLGQSGQITIPTGADSVSVTLTAMADQLKEKKESVTMTLNAGTGYKASKPKKAKLKFVDAP